MVGQAPDHPSPPGAQVLFGTDISADELPEVRQQVEAIARGCGLTPERASDWVTAVNELMTNVIRHGGGTGRLRVWRDGRLICEVQDQGVGFSASGYTSPRDRPALSPTGGMGLWIAQQMTDEIEIDSGPAGTTVRISTAIPERSA